MTALARSATGGSTSIPSTTPTASPSATIAAHAATTRRACSSSSRSGRSPAARPRPGGMDADLPAQAERAGGRDLALERSRVVHVQAGPVDRRPDARGTGGDDELRAREEELRARAVGDEPEGGGQVGAAEREREDRRMLGERVRVPDPRRVLHQRDQRALELGRPVDGLRGRLRHEDADRDLEPGNGGKVPRPVLAQGVVDADEPRRDARSLDERADRGARLVLRLRRDAVFEVEDHRVGRARERALALPLLVTGEDQERARRSELAEQRLHPAIMSDIYRGDNQTVIDHSRRGQLVGDNAARVPHLESVSACAHDGPRAPRRARRGARRPGEGLRRRVRA